MSKSQSDNFTVQEIFRKSDFSGKTALVLSTWFGIGLLPFAPGTFGTLATVPLVFGFAQLGLWFNSLFLLIMIGVAIWASGRSRHLLGREDPPEVVIDEAVGFLIVMFLLPPSCLSFFFGFVLFRIFDILKPYPIKRLERCGEGFGIVLDDMSAGVYAHLCIRIILHVLNRA